MDEDSVTYEMKDAIGIIRVNRPKYLNALNADVLQGLILTLGSVRSEGARVAIITGSGEKAFVAGADIASMNGLGQRAISDYVELGQRCMRLIEQVPFPVIAAVNGFALGGGLELALACDMILAAESARVGQPEVKLGIIPGFGGTQRLLQRCSMGIARRLVYTGEMISAEQAHQFGIVDEVVPDGELLARAEEISSEILKQGPLAVAKAKEVFRQSEEQRMLSGLRLEVEAFLELFKSSDRAEGMAAFLEKRAPHFTGK